MNKFAVPDAASARQALFRYLPSRRRFALHLALLLALAFLLGPLLGPWVMNWINPPQAWGAGGHAAGLGDVLPWGMAFLMFEAFVYTGWLVVLARRGWDEAHTSSWHG